MKKLMYFEFCPGCAFKAVSVRTRKLWLFGVQHLVLWRNDLAKKPHCYLEWMHEDLLFERHLIK